MDPSFSERLGVPGVPIADGASTSSRLSAGERASIEADQLAHQQTEALAASVPDGQNPLLMTPEERANSQARPEQGYVDYRPVALGGPNAPSVLPEQIPAIAGTGPTSSTAEVAVVPNESEAQTQTDPAVEAAQSVAPGLPPYPAGTVPAEVAPPATPAGSRTPTETPPNPVKVPGFPAQ